MADLNNLGSTGVGSPSMNGSAAAGSSVDWEKMYKELETKIGTQGQELGEYRTFFQNVAPVLDKLEQNPSMVQAIIDGKIDENLAKAVFEGRVNISDAQVVAQAHTEVKTALGTKEYNAMTPEDITKLVEQKTNEIRKEFSERTEEASFIEKTNKFIEKTSDFADYAGEIDKWLDTHDVTDIEVAYYAVKGQMSESQAKKTADQIAAEREKELALNASGGGTRAQYSGEEGRAIIDSLVAARSNPNSFF